MDVNVFQATILCLFNLGLKRYTFEEIQQKTGIDKELIEQSLLPLCKPYSAKNPKSTAPIIKKGEGKSVKPAFEGPKEPFSLIETFNHNNIKLNYIPAKSTKRATAAPTKEDKQLQDECDAGRKYQIQMHIVKIMKTRKTETYQNVLTGVMGAITNFKVQPQQFKTQIEDLISQAYLKRDEKERAKLIYLP